MRNKLTLFILFSVAMVFGLVVFRQFQYRIANPLVFPEATKIRVLTYTTFMSPVGPGKEIFQKFEQEKNCKVEVVSSSDAGLMLERLKIASDGLPFDLVIGLDQILVPQAIEQFKWRPQVFAKSGRHPILSLFSNDFLVPFDWSPLTFVFRKNTGSVPKNLNELIQAEFKNQFALQDPHSSSPGLQFYQWIRAVKKDQTLDFLKQFKPQVHSISPSWAFAYGIFKKEQVRFVFSYLTSLAFHWGHEKDRSFQVLAFEEGHPVQVEFMGVPDNCRNCELAQALLDNLLSPNSQKLIMEKNFMFPVIKDLEVGTIFEELPTLKVIQTDSGKDLREWDQVFAQ